MSSSMPTFHASMDAMDVSDEESDGGSEIKEGTTVVLYADGLKAAFSTKRLTRAIAKYTSFDEATATEPALSVSECLPETISVEDLTAQVVKVLSSHRDCAFQDAAGEYDYEMLRRTVPDQLVEVYRKLRQNTVKDSGTVRAAPRVSMKFYDFVERNGTILQELLERSVHTRVTLNYYAMCTLRRTYLLKVGDVTAELPEHMYMRQAIVVSNYNLARIPDTFRILSQHFATHATPTICNAGTDQQQLASCYLMEVESDSIQGIFNTLTKMALISKSGGGLGVNLQNIRNEGSSISSGGQSNGLNPVIKLMEDTTSYVSQGNKRRGSCAVYIETWNRDIFPVMDIRLNTGGDSVNRSRDIFTGLVINDLFEERVKQDGYWCLFCKTRTPDLINLFGPAFTERYVQYEAKWEEYGGKRVKAMSLWKAVVRSIQATGTPYTCSKSNMNKSQHTGLFGPDSTVRMSNLCAEIMQYTSPTHTAVCNLATVKLDRFITDPTTHNDSTPMNTGGFTSQNAHFDFAEFGRVVRIMIHNLDNTIDLMHYPTECARRSNTESRPVGLGVQGLADLFIKLGMPYTSSKALELDRNIFETMYFYALEESCAMAREYGSYPRYAQSPAAKGILQFDFYGEAEQVYATGCIGRDRWMKLRAQIAEHGLRNSLLTACPPTASTASIMQSTESFEPVYNPCYMRKTIAGVFYVLNRCFWQFMKRKGMWTKDVQQLLMHDRGSCARIPMTAEERELFRVALDMSMKVYIDHAIARSRFMEHSMSLNLFWVNPTFNKISSAIFYGMDNGLKTMSYYVRRRPKTETQTWAGISDARADKIAAALAAGKFELEEEAEAHAAPATVENDQSTPLDEEECLMCGS